MQFAASGPESSNELHCQPFTIDNEKSLVVSLEPVVHGVAVVAKAAKSRG